MKKKIIMYIKSENNLHVSCRVDEPGKVEDGDISEDGDEEGGGDVLAPDGGDQGGQEEGGEDEGGEVVAVLEHHQGVSLQPGPIFFSRLNDNGKIGFIIFLKRMFCKKVL